MCRIIVKELGYLASGVGSSGDISVGAVGRAGGEPFRIQIYPNFLRGKIPDSGRHAINLPVITKLRDTWSKDGCFGGTENQVARH